MRITLIHPRLAEGYQTPAVMEPLALAILAALTPKAHTIRTVDERLEEVPFAEPADLVAISVSTFSATRAYAIAANYRQRGVPVVMGGFHPTLQPEEALNHADVVAMGDAEGSWPQILRDAATGRLQRLYSPTSRPSEPTQPDRSVFRGKKYLPLRLVQFGRGCPRACEF
ncbi:MAG: cobalamin-dependent protein, partial [Verrucomicrobia bacterium]|nr:cobalamin-dependent protein [Verrucomicrobiota bacterium]